MAAEQSEQRFQEIGQQVVRRLLLAGWLDVLGRTAPWVYLGAAVAALGFALSGVFYFHLGWAVALVLCHLVGTAVWVWLRRPSPIAAMAVWDERARRREMFTSAYCFEQLRSTTAAQQLHLRQAGRQLDEDLPALARDVPARLSHRCYIAPIAFLALAAFALSAPASRTDPFADQAAKDRAREVANKLDQRDRMEDKGKQLTEDEKEKIRQIERSIDETVEKLKSLDDETRRDVLKELEQRAHAAEQLADAMGGADGDPQSSELIAELARHADTADFASALKTEDLEDMQDEAKRLAKRLENKELTRDEQKRIQDALARSLSRANKQDEKTDLAKRLRKAKQDLQNQQPRLAAKQFRDLAQRYRQALQRRQTQQRLRQLARRLRASGQNIFGPRQAGMRRLVAQRSPAGLQRLGSQQLQGRSPLLQRRLGAPQGQLARAGGQQPLTGAQAPIPGQGQMPGAMPGQVPGAGQGQMPGQGGSPIPGQGNCPGGQCPVPGQGAGSGQGAGQGSGQGSGTPQGGMPGQGAGVGGHQAGHGSAPLGGGSASPFRAAKTDRVNAQVSGQGPAQVRAIDPGQRGEETELSLQQLAAATMAAEEEALADEPLPLSRREQVLRYFTALRRQLTTNESSND